MSIINTMNMVSTAIETATAVTPSLSFAQKAKNFIKSHKSAVIGGTVAAAAVAGGTTVAVIKVKKSGKLNKLTKSKKNEEATSPTTEEVVTDAEAVA